MEFSRRKVLPIPPAMMVKWPGQILDEGFTPFPKRLLRCLDGVFKGESAIDELRVVLAIADYARPNLNRYPSFDFLAFTAGMPLDRFRQVFLDLHLRGWIEIHGSEDAVQIKMTGLVTLIEKLSVENP